MSQRARVSQQATRASQANPVWEGRTEERPVTVSNMPPATLIDALPEAAVVIDRSHQVTAANQKAVEVFHSNPLGLSITSVLRNPSFAPALKLATEARQPAEVDIDFHGRPPRQVNAYIAPFGDQGETLIVLRDLTREQAIEKMRSDFVANASHEMRTPLATIIGTIETLQGAAKNDAKARDMFLTTMLTQANRMKRLIDDLLVLSRIELKEHVRPQGKVSLSSIARQAKANLTRQSAELNVAIEVSNDPDATVSGDADELLQVAQNLIENAIKYGGDGGRVNVRWEAGSRDATLVVQDYGKGIAEIHLPRLTERFYRVSNQESRQRGGTGLGLAIVKHIVLRHRGRLDISSRQGHGSIFSVSIPLYKT